MSYKELFDGFFRAMPPQIENYIRDPGMLPKNWSISYESPGA
jgi:hypothetical protein